MAMNRREEDIGKYFKERFEDFKQEPSGKLWEQIRENAELTKYNRIQSRKRIALYTVSALVAVVVWLFLTPKSQDITNNITPNLPKNKSSEIIVQENIIDTTKEIVLTTSSSIEKETTENSVSEIIHSTSQTSETPIGKPEKTEKATPIEQTMPKQEVVKQDKKSSTSTNSNALDITPWTEFAVNPFQKVEIVKENADKVLIIEEELPNDNVPEEIILPTEGKPQPLFIPKGFTPNADGTNDYFLAYSASTVTHFEMSILDRKSQLLFRSRDIMMGWDGTSHGQPAPTGTYIYVITYKDAAGEQHVVKGSVVLYR